MISPTTTVYDRCRDHTRRQRCDYANDDDGSDNINDDLRIQNSVLLVSHALGPVMEETEAQKVIKASSKAPWYLSESTSNIFVEGGEEPG